VFEALRAYNNLGVQLEVLDRSEETMPLMEEALELARRRGDRQWVDALTAATVIELINAGRWDEAEELARDYEPLTIDAGTIETYAHLVDLSWQRGDEAGIARWLDRTAAASGDEGDRQRRQTLQTLRRTTLSTQGGFDEALAAAETEVLDQLEKLEQNVLVGYGLRATASLVVLAKDRSPAERALGAVQAFYGDDAPRSVTAETARLDGVLTTLRGEHDDAAERFGIALAAARSLGYVPWVAEILVDYAASLVADDRREDAEQLLAEAREIAERLRWVRLLARIEELERAGRGERVPA
jgi:tetratricopeptide (TPR) repeat protein